MNSNNLQKSNPVISRLTTDDDGNTKLSLYKDSPLRESTYKAGEGMLKTAFNNFDDKMSILLLDQTAELGFTNKRFMDAVRSVIKNHKYPTITIGEILNHDKKINLRTYEQVSKEQKEFGNTIWEYYKPVDIKGKCYYVHKRELEQHDIELPEYKPPAATDKTNYTHKFKEDKPFSISDFYDRLVSGEAT